VEDEIFSKRTRQLTKDRKRLAPRTRAGFCGFAHYSAVPGIRGAIDVVKKKYRSRIRDEKVEMNESDAKQAAAEAELKIASRLKALERAKRRLNKLKRLRDRS
jgi:hypothetical protein